MNAIPSSVLFAEIADRMLERTGIPQKTSVNALRTIAQAISGALAEGNRVEIRRFGSFRSKQFGGRTARNPQNGETIKVGPRSRASFKAAARLMDRINQAE